MNDAQLKSEYTHEHVTMSGMLVGAVFFLVLSQALIIRMPEIVTQVFRPMIVFFLMLRMMQRGRISFPARRIALIAAAYCTFDVLLHAITGDELLSACAVVLYLMMFCAVVGTPWSRREIRFIVNACFWGAFICAVVIFISNDPTDLQVSADGTMEMLGVSINRNKNAYAFAIGTIIGVLRLLYGGKKHRLAVLAMTAIIAYALMYSQCRGAFICAVAGIVIIILGSLFKIRNYNQGKFLFYLIMAVILFAGVYYALKNSDFSRLVDGESTSGRDEGIKHAWELFLDSNVFGKIFGNGYGYESAHTVGVGAHLVYATYLLATGVIGSALIALIFITSGFRIKGAVSYALFMCAFLRTFFEGLDYYIYIPLILAIIIYNYSAIYGRDSIEVFKTK